MDICLKRIFEEIESLDTAMRSLIKIYVSDNASIDETSEVISKYQCLYDINFEAIRNSENKGMDFNFSQCYEAATTPYVWIFGDDDVMLPGGLKKVINILSDRKIDILYVNNYWFQDNYLDKPKNEKQGLTILEDTLAFTRRTNVMLTFLSGLIVRSGIGQNYRNEMAGSNLIQLSWVLPLLRDGKNFAVIEDWVVAAKGSNSGGYGLIRVFGNNLKKISSSILANTPVIARVIQNGTIVNFFPGFILGLRNGDSNFLDKDIAEGLAAAFSDNWRYYIFLLPLIKLPLTLITYYNGFIKVFRRCFNSVLV